MSRLTKRITEATIELSAKANPFQYNGSPQRVHLKHPFWNVFDRLCKYEDKEEQGLLITLPVPIGGTVWSWEYPTRIDEDGSTWTICDRRRAKVVPKKFHLMMLDKMGDMYFATEAEAEEALAKMGGSHEL